MAQVKERVREGEKRKKMPADKLRDFENHTWPVMQELAHRYLMVSESAVIIDQ